VGSEMCIRDRALPAGHAVRRRDTVGNGHPFTVHPSIDRAQPANLRDSRAVCNAGPVASGIHESCCQHDPAAVAVADPDLRASARRLAKFPSPSGGVQGGA